MNEGHNPLPPSSNSVTLLPFAGAPVSDAVFRERNHQITR